MSLVLFTLINFPFVSYNLSDSYDIYLKIFRLQETEIGKMSWAADEWKSDLTHRAQQKVEQLEGQLNRLKKEAEMKQFKIDSMEQVYIILT